MSISNAHAALRAAYLHSSFLKPLGTARPSALFFFYAALSTQLTPTRPPAPSPLQEARLIESDNTKLIEKDGGEHFIIEPKHRFPMVPPKSKFEGMLKNTLGIDPSVVNSLFKYLGGIATDGCGEKVFAHGFYVVVTTDTARFLERIVPKEGKNQPWLYTAELTKPPHYNKYNLKEMISILKMSGAAGRFVQNDFVCVGSISVVDGQTGEIQASRVVANKDMRVPEGVYDGVHVTDADEREAVGMAAKGRCLVLTCTSANCQINGSSGGSMRMFFHGGEGEAGALNAVRVVPVPTKAPMGYSVGGGGGLGSGSGAAVEEAAHPHYAFNKVTMVPEYTEAKLPVALQNEFEIEMEVDGYDQTVTRTGRDVINATLNLMSWVARGGVSVHVEGRPSQIEAAKGALLIIGDPEQMFGKKVSLGGDDARAHEMSDTFGKRLVGGERGNHCGRPSTVAIYHSHTPPFQSHSRC